MQRFSAAAGFAAIIFACSHAERQLGDPIASYELVSVSGKPIAQACSNEELRSSRYELSGSRWLAVDTVFKDCTDSLRPEYTRVRQDSGVFSLRGDTIQFENPHPKLHEARVVLKGLLRGDTLTVWGSDEDGGDDVFVRRRAP
jgi:hypothetical protein